MQLSIIIVNWNTKDLLVKSLDSIFAFPPPGDFDVWVADNASTDGSAEAIRKQFPQVRLITSQENLGFAGGNNLAIRQASGRYILLLNPDTEVKRGALTRLVDFMDAHPEAGAAGPQTLNPDNTLQTSCYPLPTLSREFWRLFHLDKIRPYGVYDMSRWDTSDPRPVEVLMGSCIIIRREALEQVGLFDEDYFMYTEEVDLCYRLKKKGWQLFWVPRARILHYGGQSTQQIASEMFIQLYKSKIMFFRKHYGYLAGVAYKMILVSAALARLLISPLAWLEKPSSRQRHLKLATNYYRLILDISGM